MYEKIEKLGELMTRLYMNWQELFCPLPDKDRCVKLVTMALEFAGFYCGKEGLG